MDALLILVTAMVAVALAVAGAELTLRALVPARLDAALTDAFGGPTTASLPSPLLPAILRGRLDEVVVRATAVPVGGGQGRLDTLDVHLHDVTFSVGELGRDVRAGRGTYRARIEEDSLAQLGELPPVVKRLELDPDTLWVTTLGGVRVATTVEPHGRRLVVRPRSRSLAQLPFAELPIDLPELPAGATVTGISLRAGHLIATGPIDGDRLLT